MGWKRILVRVAIERVKNVLAEAAAILIFAV